MDHYSLELTEEEFELLREWLILCREYTSAENVKRDISDFLDRFGF